MALQFHSKKRTAKGSRAKSLPIQTSSYCLEVWLPDRLTTPAWGHPPEVADGFNLLLRIGRWVCSAPSPHARNALGRRLIRTFAARIWCALLRTWPVTIGHSSAGESWGRLLEQGAVGDKQWEEIHPVQDQRMRRRNSLLVMEYRVSSRSQKEILHFTPVAAQKCSAKSSSFSSDSADIGYKSRADILELIFFFFRVTGVCMRSALALFTSCAHLILALDLATISLDQLRSHPHCPRSAIVLYHLIREYLFIIYCYCWFNYPSLGSCR